MSGFKTPIVCKEVYLPIDSNFINPRNGRTFGEFANDYKTEYGIDLHDLFGLIEKAGNLYEIRIKTPTKIYSVGSDPDEYSNWFNVVKEGILDLTPGNHSDELLMLFAIESNNSALGFQIVLPSEVSSGLTIDDLIIKLYEI